MGNSAHKTAVRLATQLARLDMPKDLRRMAAQLRDRMALPMAVVLHRVKGDSIAAKAARIPVSRQTFYEWLHERSRPNRKRARRLARLTRYSIKRIEAKGDF